MLVAQLMRKFNPLTSVHQIPLPCKHAAITHARILMKESDGCITHPHHPSTPLKIQHGRRILQIVTRTRAARQISRAFIRVRTWSIAYARCLVGSLAANQASAATNLEPSLVYRPGQ